MIHTLIDTTHTKLVKRISIFYLLLCMCGFSHAQNQLDVLFIGNSLTYYNELPQMFKDLSESMNKTVHVDMRASGGKSLYKHALDSLTVQKIEERNWDFIILQGSSRRAAYPETFNEEPYEEGLLMLKSIIENNCTSTRILLFMPWAYEDGMTWYQGWLQDYASMQRDIYANTLDMSEKHSLSVAPVGWAWYEVLKTMSYLLHHLHSTDWVHPNEKGSYLTACAIYNSIFLEKTFGSSYVASIEKLEAQDLQRFADNIVLNDSIKWQLSAYVDTTPSIISNTKIIGNNSSKSVKLYQNYPNPFQEISYIKFELKRSMPVRIQLFDIEGKNCGTLLNETCEQGIHIHPIRARSLKDGVYFIHLTADNFSFSKKIQIKKATPY